jgi:hypothetical protein
MKEVVRIEDARLYVARIGADLTAHLQGLGNDQWIHF